jgi:hypothetical protein
MDNKEDVQNSKHNKSQARDIFVYLLGKNKNTVHKEAFPFFVFLLIIRPMFNEGMMRSFLILFSTYNTFDGDLLTTLPS